MTGSIIAKQETKKQTNKTEQEKKPKPFSHYINSISTLHQPYKLNSFPLVYFSHRSAIIHFFS